MPRRSSSENRVIGPVKYYGRPEKRKSPVLPTQIEEPEPVPEPTPPVSPILPPKSSRTSSKANSRESKARQPSKRTVKTPPNVSKPESSSTRGRARRNTTGTSSRSSGPSTSKKSPKKPKKAAPKAKKSPKNARKPRISTPEAPDDVYTPPEDVPRRRFNRKPSDPLINHDYDMEFEEVPRHLDSEDSEFQWRDPEEVPDVKMETWDPDFGDALPILEKPRLLELAAEVRQKPRLLEASKALQMTVKPEGRSKNASEGRQSVQKPKKASEALQKPRLLEEPVIAPEARQPIIEWQNELIPVPLPAGEILPDHVIMNSRIVNCEVKDMILANCVVEGCKFYNSKHYIV